MDSVKQMEEMEMLQNSLQSAKCQITDLKKQLKEGNDSQRTEDSNSSNIMQLAQAQRMSQNSEEMDNDESNAANVSNLGFSSGSQHNVSMNVDVIDGSIHSGSSSPEWWLCEACGFENNPKHAVCMTCDTQCSM